MARATPKNEDGNPIGIATKSDGKTQKFIVRKVVEEMEGDEKKLVLQLLEFSSGHQQYRLGYYVKGKSGDMRSKWIWARSAPMINPEHLESLLSKARMEGWYPTPLDAGSI